MPEPLSFDAPDGEALSILDYGPEGKTVVPHAHRHGFEFSCRGDRVPLAVLIPDSEPPYPTLLLQSAPDPAAGWTSLPGLEKWLAAGVAIASIEFPLFGSRRSEKLSEKLNESLVTAARGDPIDAAATLLWEEFSRQAVMELRRTLDVLASAWSHAPTSTVFAGVGIGASLGALLCAVDERPRGAVLALTGGGFGPVSIDPTGFVADVAPRPLLFVNEEAARARAGAPAIPKDRAIELHEAAGEPKQVCWQVGDAADALEPAWEFLAPLLGVG